MILYNLYRKASKKSGRPETNSSKKNKKKWKTVNCLIYEIIRKRCYSLPLTRLQLTMTRFFPSFLKLSMRNAWSSLTTPGAISPETRTRLVFEKGDNLGTILERRQTRVTKSRLAFKLDLIGWQDGASFLEQSKSKVKQTQKELSLLFDSSHSL